MNINRKFIIILGVSTLLLVTIFGLKAYYQERTLQELTQISGEINHRESFFDKNYPTSLEERILFNRICANAIVSRPKQEFEPLLCEIVEDKNYSINGKYTVMPSFLKIFSSLPIGQYIAIVVNYNDLLEKNISTISADSAFNICSITKPALINPFREEMLLKNQINTNRNIVFPEGELFCSKFSNLPSETLNLIINGFIPKTDLLEARIYLVPEDTSVNDLLSQESFAKIENILQSYSLLWNVEKLVYKQI